MDKKDIIGGQAVIEGIMMMNGPKIAIAVRKPNKKIAFKYWRIKRMRSKLYNIPLIRGVVRLFVMLFVGLKALNYSTEMSLGEDEKELSSLEIIVMIALSFGLAIAIFKLIPLFMASLFSKNVSSNYVLFNVVDGVSKIGLFVLYVWSLSFFSDVKRLFQYHGAEHKAVHCYESGKKLTVNNVKGFTTLHPRCGTAFVMVVLTISIIVYTFIPSGTTFLEKFFMRLIYLPLIAGISYEILRASAGFNNFIFKMITYPGLMLQKITTTEPDDEQIKVAIKALKKVI